MLVGAEGFELSTLCSQSRCATRLRYAPTQKQNYSTTPKPALYLDAIFFKQNFLAQKPAF